MVFSQLGPPVLPSGLWLLCLLPHCVPGLPEQTAASVLPASTRTDFAQQGAASVLPSSLLKDVATANVLPTSMVKGRVVSVSSPFVTSSRGTGTGHSGAHTAISSKPAVNNSAVTHTAISSKPAVNNSAVTHTAISSKPVVNNSAVTHTAISSKPAVNKSAVTQKAISSKPAVNNSAVTQKAISPKPAVNNNSTVTQKDLSSKSVVHSSDYNSVDAHTVISPKPPVDSTRKTSAVTHTIIRPSMSSNINNKNNSNIISINSNKNNSNSNCNSNNNNSSCSSSSNNNNNKTNNSAVTAISSKPSVDSTNNNTSATYYINEEDCGKGIVHVHISAKIGTVFVMNSSRQETSPRSEETNLLPCNFHLQVADRLYITARIKRALHCRGAVNVYKALPLTIENEIAEIRCGGLRPPFLISSSNHLYFKNTEPNIFFLPKFSIHFATTEKSLRTTLPTVYSNRTPLSGYITSPGFDGHERLPNSLDAHADLNAPPGYAIMVSFPHFHIMKHVDGCSSFLKLLAVPYGHFKKCSRREYSTAIYNTTKLRLTLHTGSHSNRKKRIVGTNLLGTGFKMLFSFHLPGAVPATLINGLYNCSVHYYPSFQQHLHCNMQPQCQGGEDETGRCSFSNIACQGKVASYDKCYFALGSDLFRQRLTWNVAKDVCEARGAHLATVKTSQEFLDLNKLFAFNQHRFVVAYVGMVFGGTQNLFSHILLRSSPHPTISFMYRYIWQWTENTVMYSMAHIDFEDRRYNQNTKRCVQFQSSEVEKKFYSRGYKNHGTGKFVCETELHMTEPSVVDFSANNNVWLTFAKKDAFVTCPGGHVTHTFLSCDQHSHCGAQDQYIPHCPFSGDLSNHGTSGKMRIEIPQFSCTNERMAVHYTLVCDHRYDCNDMSDESFCRHPRCKGFRCANGQCIDAGKECDHQPDCLYNSDEENCLADPKPSQFNPALLLQPPAVIRFDGRGYFTQTKLSTDEPCPKTHYRCPSELTYCLPVYTRCNGFYDCIRREDEVACGTVTCPGLYRCRKSSVCVHPDHMCDGWPQCPQHDDEWLCEVTCPASCLCQGYAAVCLVPFMFPTYSHMRYVDASGSGAKLSDFGGMIYLVYLILRKCLLAELTEISDQNLQVLDLSRNQLQQVNTRVFHNLTNLKELRLAENPLASLYGGHLDIYIANLTKLDISSTKMSLLDNSVLSQFPHLQKLNMSYTYIQSIGSGAFHDTPYLMELDMRGSPIEHFPLDIFKGLQQLSVVYAPIHRLCCKALFAQQSNNPTCVSHKFKLSSCTSLLGSKLYQIYVWLACSLATSGNVLCAIVRHQRTKTNGFDVLVTNLNCVGFVKGICLGMIGTADALFRGNYLHYELVWENSSACIMSGFVSLLSLEVSALILCCITLDRSLSIVSSDAVHFGRRSATVAAAVVWLLGGVIAAVPVFPSAWRRQLFHQTGVCVPALVSSPHYAGHIYVYGILGIFNTLLFLVICMNQIYIYLTLKRHSIFTGLEKPPHEWLLSQRMVAVAVTDCVCWFIFSTLSLSSTFAKDLGSEPTLALALFMVSIDSVINPYLYIVNIWLEKKQVARHARLIVLLKHRVLHRK